MEITHKKYNAAKIRKRKRSERYGIYMIGQFDSLKRRN
jgi:hypothetical protein